MIEILQAAQYRKMLWKNGAGYTLEIARSQGEGDFDWRISMADVTTSGPFSTFPNKQRMITVLDGHGIVLHVDDLPAQKLHLGDVFAFHGESQVQSELVDGVIRDLNLIYNPEKFHARFQWFSGHDEHAFLSSAALIFIFNHGAEMVVEVDGNTVVLPPNDTLKIAQTTALSMVKLLSNQAKNCCVMELIPH